MSAGINSKSSKIKILIAPLDWGLGHATRCIPIIKTLLQLNVEPVIAAYGSGYLFLKNEFPELQITKFPGFKLEYPKGKYLRWKVLLWLPVLIISIIREHFALKMIINELKIDAVISDGRYGLFSKKCPAVFITHQLSIKLPGPIGFLEYPAYLINRMLINKYTFCWLPDVEGEINLAGDLCHKYNNSMCDFIGPLNRFRYEQAATGNIKIDILIIISGLEKQRSVFEEIIFRQVELVDKNIVILQGLPGETNKFFINDNVTVYSHLEASQIFSLMLDAELVICRSGYSTIMELASMGKRAVFVPTPGQTEQEYLAEYYEEKKYAPSFSQPSFDLNEALTRANNYTGIPKIEEAGLLINAAGQLIKEIDSNRKPKLS